MALAVLYMYIYTLLQAYLHVAENSYFVLVLHRLCQSSTHQPHNLIQAMPTPFNYQHYTFYNKPVHKYCAATAVCIPVLLGAIRWCSGEAPHTHCTATVPDDDENKVWLDINFS